MRHDNSLKNKRSTSGQWGPHYERDEEEFDQLNEFEVGFIEPSSVLLTQRIKEKIDKS